MEAVQTSSSTSGKYSKACLKGGIAHTQCVTLDCQCSCHSSMHQCGCTHSTRAERDLAALKVLLNSNGQLDRPATRIVIRRVAGLFALDY